MASIDDLSGEIGSSSSASDTTHAQIGKAKADADELAGDFRAMDADGQAGRAEAVTRILEEAQGMQAGVKSKLDEATAAVEAMRDGGGLPAGGSPAPAAGGAPATAAPVFRPMRTDPAKRDEIAPYVGQDIAYATLWDAEGNKVVGVHCADDDGPAKDAKWGQPWGSYPRLRRHVEAHAAARMKEGETMAMYINLPPCSYTDGCKLNLSDILPKGSTLWVHQVRPSGTVDAKRFKGTGRAYE